MYLYRKIDDFLNEWHVSKAKKPLIIKGARQVGKTESIRRFAKCNYESFVEINFVENPEYEMIINQGFSAESIVKNISLINAKFNFIPNKTLIFFDEVQQFPNIASSLKFFMQDGRYDVICSGSLLGVNYKKIDSISVGYKQDVEMKSMDFEEFLYAKGYTKKLIDELYSHLIDHIPLSDLEMKKYFDLFIEYSLTGGMPEAVSNYIQTNVFTDVFSIQKQIVEGYYGDIRKYLTGLDQTRVINVLRHIPVNLGKDNKKFQISKVAHGARARDYMGTIEWLDDAGLINICYCISFPELPLKGNYIDSNFKLYFFDTGLFLNMLDEETVIDFKLNRNLGVYKGAIFENIVAEALSKSGFDLYFYKKDNSTLEEDFFIRNTESLIPVEVKAGNNRSKTLRTLIDSNDYPDISWGIKVANANIGYENKILTIPLFMTFLLKRYMNDMNYGIIPNLQ